MPFDTFVPAVMPVVDGAPRKLTLKIRSAEFADGYNQEAPDGINYARKTASLSWPWLKVSDAQAIEAFIIAHAAVPFLFQVPGEAVALQWKCTDSSRNLAGNYRETMTMQLKQDFSFAPPAVPKADFSDPADSQVLAAVQ